MMSTNEHWNRSDIQNLKNECKNEIKMHKPPPRCLDHGKINVKHFIYVNETLKNKIQNLQETLSKTQSNLSLNSYKELQNQLKSTTRKLNNRELQLKELRKRIDNLNQKTISNKMKMNELTLKHTQYQKIINDLENQNQKLRKELTVNKQEITKIRKKTQTKIADYIDEINDLKKIIKTLEPNEISVSEEESEEQSNQSDYDREMTEPRSSSSSANTQDKDFVVDDLESDENSLYAPGIDESSSDDDMVDESN